MEKEEYLKQLEQLKQESQSIAEKMSKLKETYIGSNKPCEVDDLVEIVLQSGRKAKGEAKTFGILSDGNVHVISYKEVGEKTGMRYITVPTQSVVKI